MVSEVSLTSLSEIGAVDRIRTCGLIVGNDALLLAELLLRKLAPAPRFALGFSP